MKARAVAAASIGRPLLDLTILVPARDEADNLRRLIPGLHRAASTLGLAYEILVVDGGSRDDTSAVGRHLGATVLAQSGPGYGSALREGFHQARGAYVLTLDADLSHEPSFIGKLWTQRDRAEVIIASRYVRGGVAYMPWSRWILSRVLNRAMTAGLAIGVRDISSGFRLYRSDVVRSLPLQATDFDILPEIAVRAHVEGWRIAEVPFTYYPRAEGRSHARVFRVGLHLTRTFGRLWRLRYSIAAADYDEQAFYSWLLPQRYWQRRRHQIVTRLARDRGRTLDVGCGSSVILQSLNHVIGVEIRHAKVRYMRRYGLRVITGSAFALPLADASMDCVICSEMIEHVAADPVLFAELDRVLRPGGLLILGTPDYATWTWNAIEWLYGKIMPRGYADEHISCYSRAGLIRLLAAMGYTDVQTHYICRSEVILAGVKTGAPIDLAALREILPAARGAIHDPGEPSPTARPPSHERTAHAIETGSRSAPPEQSLSV